MEPLQILIAGIIFFWIVAIALIFWIRIKKDKQPKKKSGISWCVPPPPPRKIKPTIETRYGQDLKETAVNIFLETHPVINHEPDRVKYSVEKAKELIDEVCMVCSKIDHERNAELKAFAKMSEPGIKP